MRADLEQALLRYNLSTSGTVPMLRQRLSVHLRKLESKVRKNVVHIVNVQLSKPTALCMASDDVLLVADDGLRVIHQVSLERDGVTIRGKPMRTLSNYPTHIESVESMTILESNVYFAGSKNDKCQGGLYSVSMETTLMECAIQNGDQSCKEIKRVSKFNELLVFTDIGARDVKSFNPHTNEVVHLAGDGCDAQNDGTGRCCSFIQAHGICCISNTIFVTNAATGKVKLVVSMSGTLSLLYHLGLIYDSFGNTCKGSTPVQMTPELGVSNVRKVHQYVQSTVRKVKESDQLKEDALANGPQGTVSKKTQTSIELLLKGMTNLMINLEKVNPEFKYNVVFKTLLTTEVENLHSVSHFKNETFSTLQYAMDFGTIAKESPKRVSKWAAKYFTHPASYYPVPQTGMLLGGIKFMSPLPSKTLPNWEEDAMRGWVDNFRPVRQRTVRSETTKDKAGALPPAVYTKRADSITRVFFRRDQEISADLPDKTDAEGPNVPVPKGVSLISFVDDCTIEVVHSTQSTQVSNSDCDFGEEYETDSDDSLFSDDEPDYVTNKPVTRSGRQVKAWAKFDV